MAFAYFCNTTSVEIAVNLNNELDNHRLAPLVVSATELLCAAWPARVSSNVSPGVLGTNRNSNLIVVFGSPIGGRPIYYEISYDGGSTLDLYVFVLGDNLVGEDRTGDASKVKVKRIDEAGVRAIFPTFFLVHPA